jgi:prophage maintenance system killer protein
MLRFNASTLILILGCLCAPSISWSTDKNVRLPVDGNCAFDFGQLSPSRVWTVPTDDRPLFHTMNVEEAMTQFRKLQKAELKEVKGKDGLRFLCPKKGSCFALEGISSSDGETHNLTVRDVLENKYSVPGLTSEKVPGQFDINPSEMIEVADIPALDPATTKGLRASFQQSKFVTQPNKIGEALTEAQLANSKNAVTNVEKPAYARAISEANEMLAKMLRGNESLSVEQVQKLNWFANQGTPPMGSSYLEPVPGAIRGTNNQGVVIDNKSYLIDMEMAQVNQGIGGQIINSFMPDNEVPEALNRLVARINEVGSETNPETIFAAYKDFIRIHPFLDGNGRTGRMLLNYMLLKAGLPPMTAPSQSLYYSPRELVARYVDSVLQVGDR